MATEHAMGHSPLPTRPAVVIAAAILGVALGGFFAFICFAVLSLSTSAAFTFDRTGAVIGGVGTAIGALIVIAAVALLWGRLRSVLMISCAIATLPIVWALAAGAVGGLFVLFGFAALLLAGLIIFLASRPSVGDWLAQARELRTSPS